MDSFPVEEMSAANVYHIEQKRLRQCIFDKVKYGYTCFEIDVRSYSNETRKNGFKNVYYIKYHSLPCDDI